MRPERRMFTVTPALKLPGRRLPGSPTVLIFFSFSIEIEPTHNIVLVSDTLHKDLTFVYTVYTMYVVYIIYIVSPCVHCVTVYIVSPYTLYSLTFVYTAK